MPVPLPETFVSFDPETGILLTRCADGRLREYTGVLAQVARFGCGYNAPTTRAIDLAPFLKPTEE